MGRLDGKIALITGGSDGIGFATAQQFISEGVEHVYITGRRQQLLDEAIKKLDSSKVSAIQADASKLDDLDNLYSKIKEEKGRLDILFANAGAYEQATLGSITEKHYDDIFNVNVKGVLFTVQKALPIFSDGGSIVLNGSISGSKGFAEQSVYNASKATVRSFARTWTVDLKNRRIRVNTVGTGPTETALLRSAHNYDTFGDLAKVISPMGRIGEPAEIAKAVVFLASDDSSYITGIELCVDGGIAQV
jgi:NAD(P)-dependent dehydrogenase (short-subunit alcohol dehydrogenase family)